MKIFLKKFGTTLISRQLGKEAFLAFQPHLSKLKKDEMMEVDFEGVHTLSPSWADEFLTPLMKMYPKKVIFSHTENPSVKITIEFLKSIHETKS